MEWTPMHRLTPEALALVKGKLQDLPTETLMGICESALPLQDPDAPVSRRAPLPTPRDPTSDEALAATELATRLDVRSLEWAIRLLRYPDPAGRIDGAVLLRAFAARKRIPPAHDARIKEELCALAEGPSSAPRDREASEAALLALGAIGSLETLRILVKYATDEGVKTSVEEGAARGLAVAAGRRFASRAKAVAWAEEKLEADEAARKKLAEVVQAKEAPRSRYSPKDTFRVGDIIDHPKFGVGLVESTEPTKIAVRFADSIRSLVQGMT